MNTKNSGPRVVMVMNDVLRGGAQRIAADIALAVETSTITHIVYFNQEGGDADTVRKDFSNAGVELLCLGQRAGFFKRCVILVRFLREQQPDIVHTLLPYASFVGRIAGFLCGIPVISTQCNLPFAYTRKIRIMDTLTLPLVAAWVGATHAIEIAYGGHGARQYTPELWREGRRHFTAYGGVSMESMRARAASVNRADKRASLGIGDGAWVVLMIARFVGWKGHADLVKALSLMPKDTELLLVGFGGEEDTIRGLVKEHMLESRVHFLGSRDDVYELLAAADVYAQTHTYHAGEDGGWQGPNLSQIEAAAAGIPVVSTAVPLTEVLFEEGKTGWLAKPNDPQDIARALLEVRANPEKAKLYATAAQERVRQFFSMEHMVYTYESLYQKCAKNGTV